MHPLNVFLNTRVENSGILAWVGDKGLTPFRYLFNGATLRIKGVPTAGNVVVHHVASFHSEGTAHCSRADPTLMSSPTSMIYTLVAVILVIPGLLVGLVKVFAYASSTMRETHRLTQKALTPITIRIGNRKKPITNIEQLIDRVYSARHSHPLHPPVKALTIYGDGYLKINEDPGILALNPMKLILVGAHVVNRGSSDSRLNCQMHRTRKWHGRLVPLVRNVRSVSEALKAIHPRRGLFTCKRYHKIFEVRKQA